MPQTLAIILLGLSGPELPPTASGPFVREGDGAQREVKDAMEGRPPPGLQVEHWMNTNGKPVALESLRGKVVLIEFWGTWCGPCKASMPHLKGLYAKHKSRGFEVIGIHTWTKEPETVRTFIEREALPWPMAIDVRGRTVRAYHVDGYPDYYLVDRRGILRVADLANAGLDAALEALLSEPVAANGDAPLAIRGEELTKRWASAKYEHLREGRPAGTVRLANELVVEAGVTLVKMTDELRREGSDAVHVIRSTWCTADGRLSPVRIDRSESAGTDGSSPVNVRVGEGTVSMGGGRSWSVDAETRVVTEGSLLRLVAWLPRQPGAAWRVDLLNSSGDDLQRGVVIRSVGAESAAAGKASDWKFEIALKNGKREYWVREDHTLSRVRFEDGSEWKESRK